MFPKDDKFHFSASIIKKPLVWTLGSFPLESASRRFAHMIILIEYVHCK